MEGQRKKEWKDRREEGRKKLFSLKLNNLSTITVETRAKIQNLSSGPTDVLKNLFI